MAILTFFDLEIDPQKERVLDMGAIRSDEAQYHGTNFTDFGNFLKGSDYLCGHNILSHDLRYLKKQSGEQFVNAFKPIDTLLLSPIFFPKQPYHNLLKDDKLDAEALNNPLNDSKKARDLFFDEVNAFNQLPVNIQRIYFNLLHQASGYAGFFSYLAYSQLLNTDDLEKEIRSALGVDHCANAVLSLLIQKQPIPLAYSIALIRCNDRYSITPPWVLRNFPEVERQLFLLRNNPCLPGCAYCDKALNPNAALKRFFNFDSFREYDEKPLQEQAVQATVRGKSILAIFPTGGGKSITFQVPALMSGENAKALTVVISPLQSLMKDQVDNLERKYGITEAATINGLLDPIERSKTIERVEKGEVSLLYIAPESLRSVTIERLLLKRKITRFVIDEAHCFSSWGQDFRVDYLYIGDFILNLQRKKGLEDPIPVSCFTATAKRKVMEDIGQYFLDKLNLELEVFSANTSRKNLRYEVFNKDSEDDKYNHLRTIIETKECPTIVYVSRTKRAYQLAERLSTDGFAAKPYHGKMPKEEKSANQDAFMRGDTSIMVATSAFGMGVDKDNVGSVIHYDISDSLESYVQEAGRAGRNDKINAECFILFNEDDLDKHFIHLNQTKINRKEIDQVWKAIKDLTRLRDRTSSSALEIARKAGWDDNIRDIETRITTAIAALEDAGYVKRGQNMPQIFANSIVPRTAQEAINKIDTSTKFNAAEKIQAVRIIKKLISSKSKRLTTDEQAESRVDYISDQLGIPKYDVIRIIGIFRDEKILADAKDLTAFIKRNENINRSLNVLKSHSQIENQLLKILTDEPSAYSLKDINQQCQEAGINDCGLNKIKTVLNFWAIKNRIKKHNLEYSNHHMHISLTDTLEGLSKKLEKTHQLSQLIIEYLFEKASASEPVTDKQNEEVLVEFSVLGLKAHVEAKQGLFQIDASLDEIEDALFYLLRIESLKIEGGFLVTHNRLQIDRIELNNKIKYKESDYEKLKQHYQQKVQQIHIVGEYAKKMIRNYDEALRFVDDYFQLNNTSFLNKYFPGDRQNDIRRTLTPEKFKRLFGALSEAQLEIIKDQDHQYIVVAAGPGSGKTRVLVHKLASLLLAEDVKHEQLLMLTFSRSAATEFKKRLVQLVGNAANFIEIKTFHSYCFDLLGRTGNLSQSETILSSAIEKIKAGEIEQSRITKTVLVIDEAQDMSAKEFELVKTLMEENEEMRVILVGDDDQNIFEFRNSDSRFMKDLITEKGAEKYELVKNYRSRKNIVEFANGWAQSIGNRLKSFPGDPVSPENGVISITQHAGNNLIIPLTTEILQSGLKGSTCILTQTNEEAIQTVGALLRLKVPAKLIQTNEGFRVIDLYEVRQFSDKLKLDEAPPVISDEDWEEALAQVRKDCAGSSRLDIALNAIKEFSLANTARKYKSDWTTFLKESKIEDFTLIDLDTILVSTIHKAKGKEFDNVFLLFKDYPALTDDKKRLLYVAVTRAKHNLSIHYNGVFLKPFHTNEISYLSDQTRYRGVDQITIHLGHKDVFLGHFDGLQDSLMSLQSGSSLIVQPGGLANSGNQKMVVFSKGFRERLSELEAKGFLLHLAKVNFVVYWKGEKNEKEIKIILPEVILRKG